MKHQNKQLKHRHWELDKVQINTQQEIHLHLEKEAKPENKEAVAKVKNPDEGK